MRLDGRSLRWAAIKEETPIKLLTKQELVIKNLSGGINEELVDEDADVFVEKKPKRPRLKKQDDVTEDL